MAGFVEGFADSANFSGYGLCDFEIKLAMIANKFVLVGDPEGSLTFGAAHHFDGSVFQWHMNIAPQAAKSRAICHKYGAPAARAEENVYVA